MPEFIHSFQRGKMNKDLDERLVPNGEYRDALNLDLANSDGSNVGALQSVKGNTEIKNFGFKTGFIDELDNPVCVGSITDDANERIYWFIASDNISAIAEYDQAANLVKPVLVDTKSVLKFTKDYLITGINILDKFLFWTDNQSEPKKINIQKFKAGSTNFITHTKIPTWVPTAQTAEQEYSNINLASQPDFTEEDITVIKKSPLTAPTLDKASSKFGANINGTGVNPVTTTAISPAGTGTENFTYIPNVANNPEDYESLPTYGEFLENTTTNPNYYEDSNLPTDWDGRVSFTITPIYGIDPTTGEPVWKSGDLITLNGTFVDDFNQSYSYGITVKITSVSNNIITGEIQAISSEILKPDDGSGNIIPIIWDVVLEEEKPMFEYVFPRFAYRWKYIDNEYSSFSPFSEVAFIGDEFKYVSSDGYNTGMTNNIRRLILENLEWGTEEVAEIEILYKESHNNSVYSVDTIKKKDFSPYSTDTTLPTFFQINTEIIGALIDANQLLRPWDNVPRKAKAQEVVANRLIYGNYLQNYTVDKVNLKTSFLPHPHKSDASANSDVSSFIRMPEGSLKSIRTYQAGIVFKDQYGRETPVVTNEGASVQIPIKNSDTVNKIEVTPLGTPPSWATHYKIFVKETANEYYNLALDRFYFAEDGNVWLSFPSSERNKVDEESYLILKKQHDNDTALDELYRYKILSIQNSAPDFIATFEKTFSTQDVTITQNIGEGFTTIKFDGPEGNSTFVDGFKSGNFLKIQVDANKTESYEIAGGGFTGTGSSFDVDLASPIGLDGSFLDNETPDFDAKITLIEKVIERKPEFEGRFFVKINRDFAFDQNIVSSFGVLEPSYSITNTQQVIPVHTIPSPGSGPREIAWADNPSLLQNNLSRWNYLGTSANGEVLNESGTLLGDTDMESGSLSLRIHGRIPAVGNNFFGFTETTLQEPERGYIDYLNDMFTNSFVTEDMVPGSLIRFKTSSGDVSERPYRILGINRKAQYRGVQRAGGGDGPSGQRAISSNTRRVVVFKLDRPIDDQWIANADEIQVVEEIISDNNKILTSNNPAIFETEPKEAVDLDIYNEASNALPISGYGSSIVLNDYYNCYCYGNGAESNRIRDDYNANKIDKGPKVSAPLDEPYAEERRGSGMIFSQIFNSTSGINRLNQFVQALPITKDLNPVYGTIQKLHVRDTDAIVLCEDKCLKILANKDALYNADGNINLTGNNAVLGQAVPYAGEFGISKNPESFAQYGFRVYFSDKNRGAVIRLSLDGITNIASKGMSDFFADNLKSSVKIIGSYDDDKGLYNLTLDKLSSEWQNKLSPDKDYQLSKDDEVTATDKVQQTTVSFKEEVNGWTSRKSFITEGGVSLNNVYYTFSDGKMWEHGANTLYNNFYGVQHDSTFNLLINDQPQVVKGYSTINYTGTKTRLFEYLYNEKWYSIDEIIANKYTPTNVQQKQPGWYVNYIKTDLEGGEVKEFKKKEGKFFNYIKGLEVFDDTGCAIGTPDTVDFDAQDYLLTITIDPDCSSAESTPSDPLRSVRGTTGFLAEGVTNITPVDFGLINESDPTNDELICAIRQYMVYFISDPTNPDQGWSTFNYYWYGSDDFTVGTQLYGYNGVNDEYYELTDSASYRNSIIRLWGGNLVAYDAGSNWSDITTVPDDYYLVRIDASGVVASMVQLNTLTQPTCLIETPGSEEQHDSGLLLNGTFETSDDLTLDPAWTIHSNEWAKFDGVGGTITFDISQNLTTGTDYTLTFNVISSAGDIRFKLTGFDSGYGYSDDINGFVTYIPDADNNITVNFTTPNDSGRGPRTDFRIQGSTISDAFIIDNVSLTQD